MTRISIVSFFAFFLLNMPYLSAQSAESMNGMHTNKLRHVVLFSFTDETSASEIKSIEKAFAELPSKIDLITDFEWGTNNSPEGLDKGFTHCFLLTFDSEADRDAYLPHPAHQSFVSMLDGHVKDVTVVDYWVE